VPSIVIELDSLTVHDNARQITCRHELYTRRSFR
jgi:hypothetical protein